MRLESELETLRKSNETKAVFKAVCIPEELTPSNVDAISSLNDYAVHLLLVCLKTFVLFLKHCITFTKGHDPFRSGYSSSLVLTQSCILYD